MINRIKTNIECKKEYYRTAKKEIAKNNMQALRVAGPAGLILILIYYILAMLVVPGRKLSLPHIIILSSAIILLIFSSLYNNRKDENNSRAIAFRCIVFEVLTLIFVIMIDVIGDKTAPTSFLMPVLCVILPICFSFPFYISYGIIGFFEIVYISTIFFLKDASVKYYDIFDAIASLILSIFVQEIIIAIHIRRHEYSMKYKLLSTRDPLMPDIYNKQTVHNLAGKYLKENNPTVSSALIILDLDDFKQVNDMYGHYTGDSVLQCVGNSLKNIFRPTDIIGRFGGDEFMVFIPGSISESELTNKCNLVSRMIRDTTNNDYGFPVQCSIGAVLTNAQKVEGFDNLFCQTDDALYEAKNIGKNCFSLRIYDETRNRTYYQQALRNNYNTI